LTQVELRRVRLAIKGRKLLELSACPSPGCGAQVVRKNLRFHQLYHCENRAVACWLCGRGGLRHCDLGRHLRQEVKKGSTKLCRSHGNFTLS
jgi:hypothetical protein